MSKLEIDPISCRVVSRNMAYSFQISNAITLLGGAPFNMTTLQESLFYAPVVIGVDGGGNTELPENYEFSLVLGDLDSLTQGQALQMKGVPVIHIHEQDTTDFEKALRTVHAQIYLGVGFTGGQLDHTLAAMNTLVKNPHLKIILIGDVDIVFLIPPVLELNLQKGATVSFFPMAEVRGVISEGLRWSVQNLEMSPDKRIGTSNMATGGPIRVQFNHRKVLVILKRNMLATIIKSLY